MPWVLILTELVKFLAALIAGGAFGFVAATSSNDTVAMVSASDSMYSAVIWAGIGGVAVYLWMQGIGPGKALRFVFSLLKKAVGVVVTEWKAS